MPTFETPRSISATVELDAGDVKIIAVDDGATAVEVRPSDATNKEDVKVAELTRVEYADGELLVRTPKLRSWLGRSGGGSIDVTIELPAGSDVHGTGGSADFRCDGRLGACQIKTGLGQIRVDRADTPILKGGAGDISLDRATGRAEVKAASGDVRLRELDADAVVKNANGNTWVGVAGGDLLLKAANGDIVVDLAHADVTAKSANGDVRLGEVVRGSVVLETLMGDLEVASARAAPPGWT